MFVGEMNHMGPNKFNKNFARWILLVSLAVVFSFVAVGVGRGGDPGSANRIALQQVLTSMAARAQEHYHKPGFFGGGNGSFNNSAGGVGITMIGQLTQFPTSSIGTFSLGIVGATTLVLTGTGIFEGDDGNNIELVVTVFSDSLYFIYTN